MLEALALTDTPISFTEILPPHDRIVRWYEDYLTTDEARENTSEFDRLLPDYSWVNDTKKIDCLLWSKR